MQNQVVSRRGAGHGAADWLSLAAAPTFAFMALLTAVPGGGPLEMLCSAAPGASPFTRNGAHVPADERLPSGALAEADLQSANSASELGVLGVAAVRPLEADERSGTAGQHFEFVLQGIARTDMEARQPLAQAGAEPAGQALLAAEVDDVKLAARRQPRVASISASCQPGIIDRL